MGKIRIRLEGMMQTYGVRSMWDKRDTQHIPSLSAVVCMIASAMGTHGNSDIMRISEAIESMVVRVIEPGEKFVDFQTMQGGIQASLSAKGNIRHRPETVIVTRRFLAGAKFMVTLRTEMADQIAAALQEPRNAIYLGHRTCIPSAPLLALPHHADYDEPGEEWGEVAGGDLVMDRYIHYESRAFAPRFVGKLGA